MSSFLNKGYSTGMYGISRMNIRRLLIQETGSYNPQVLRPYSSQMTAVVQNELINAIENCPAITPSLMSGIANKIIRPSAIPESEVNIPNGWQERRLRFIMEVATTDHMGGPVQIEYLSGYTDGAGFSLSGHLDPNMLFFINTSTLTRSIESNTILGNTQTQNVIDCSHVISSNAEDAMVMSQNKKYSIRPEDVYSQMDVFELQQDGGGGLDVSDTRSIVSSNGIKSKRSNSVASIYLANTLDSYLQTSRGDTAGLSPTASREAARGNVRSMATSNDPFIGHLLMMKNSQRNWPSNAFTLGDLKIIDPNVDNVIAFTRMSVEHKNGLHQFGQTSHWGGSDGETIFATTLSHAVAGYMAEYNLNKVVFVATNRVIGGQIEVTIADAKSLMLGVDISRQISAFAFRLKNELFMDLSYSGMLDFAVEMTCDLIGDTSIIVSLNGKPPIPFTTPSFCDSLTAPVTTRNIGNLNSIVSDMSAIMSEINDTGHVHGNYVSRNQFNNI